jgi:phage/plasmid-associated DNA primase
MSIEQKTPQQLRNEARFCASERDRAELEAQAAGLEAGQAHPTINDIENELHCHTPGDGFLFNAKREATGPRERYWLDRIAATGDLIFDPLPDSFYYFADGLWTRRTRAEIREIVDRIIRAASLGAGLNLDKLLSMRPLDGIVNRLAGHPCIVRRDAFANPPHGIILVENGRLAISKEGIMTFDENSRGERTDMQLTRLKITYDATARASKTLAWLSRIFSERQGDVTAIARMAGACLWGSSRWKKMLVIHGKANLGKSQIPLLIERLIGRQRVAEFETRRLGEKFEMKRFVGKVLLRAEDVDADFMTHAYSSVLKQLTGFGSMRVEGKNSHEEFELRGDKMICATSNFRLRVRADVDRTAWEERLVYLDADGDPYSREEQDSYLLDTIFGDNVEASGVLNFALEGLINLLCHGWEISPEQVARTKRVMDQSDSVAQWARQELRAAGAEEDPARPGVTVSEGWANYLEWVERNSLDAWPERIWREMAIEAVEGVYGKTTSNNLKRGDCVSRGWRGMAIKYKADMAKEFSSLKAI